VSASQQESQDGLPEPVSPLQLGAIELPYRIVHVPTDISSSHADGEVSERDIHHHGSLARGGTGFVIVGATSPDAKTGRPTVTGLVADGDDYIPGLARLAESMHPHVDKELREDVGNHNSWLPARQPRDPDQGRGGPPGSGRRRHRRRDR
jgi:hypothetical protein